MVRLLIFIFVLVCLSHEAQAIDFRGKVFDDPLKKLSCTVRKGVPWQKPQWYRIVGDFNNDGLSDLAISTSTSLFGNADGWFKVYLGTNGRKYKYLGDLSAHPAAINFEPGGPGEALVTTYHHDTASAGVLIKQKITSKQIIDISKVEIFPGRNESDKTLYDKLFRHNKNIIVQIGYCSNNQVEWKEYK